MQQMIAPQCPLLTVDAVCFDNSGRVLVIQRKNDPFKDQWALPGGFVDRDKETVEQAVIRELLEETALDLQEGELHLLRVYSEPGRDPRGHTVSVTFAGILPNTGQAVARSDARAVDWINDWRTRRLAFDHNRIVEDAFYALQIPVREGPLFEFNLDPKILHLTTKQRYWLKRIYAGNPVDWDPTYASLLRRGLIVSNLTPKGELIFSVTTRGIAALT